MLEEYITEEEQQEYLAYKSADDFFENLEQGIQALDSFDFREYEGKSILICGGMVAFDKGLTAFMNRWYRKQDNLFFLSEVTAQYRRYTEERTALPHICTPHLLAKEMVLYGMDIPVDAGMQEIYGRKRYVREAVCNLEARYPSLGRGYAVAWSYYAYVYLLRLLKYLRPIQVVMWNEFYAFHHILQGICKENKISELYMEFGCLPGTISIEPNGQQGESLPARKYRAFRRQEVSRRQIENATQILAYLKRSGLNRNIQPLNAVADTQLSYYRAGRKTVLYMGQNDFESGICPYTRKARRYHSPIFRTTLEALEFLSVLAVKDNWNLIFKPHPIMASLGHDCKEKQDRIDIVSDVNVNRLIDRVDLVATILSQSAYIALIREKPVLMLGYTQLRGKRCTYEAFAKGHISSKILTALEKGYTEKQKTQFIRHVAQLLNYYLYDDGVEREIRFGRELVPD